MRLYIIHFTMKFVRHKNRRKWKRLGHTQEKHTSIPSLDYEILVRELFCIVFLIVHVNYSLSSTQSASSLKSHFLIAICRGDGSIILLNFLIDSTNCQANTSWNFMSIGPLVHKSLSVKEIWLRKAYSRFMLKSVSWFFLSLTN